MKAGRDRIEKNPDKRVQQANCTLGQAFGWDSRGYQAPAFAQRLDAEVPEAGNLGLDCSGVSGPLIHG
ncbi:MAG: hypothetical protein ACLQF1_19330 [Methyloceanibacter sp.]